jgi:hypothetical protein
VTVRKVGESGHQVIPAKALAHVRRELAAFCAGYGPRLVGITCLAAGADQMFAEAVLAAGGQLHVVVPARRYEQTFEDPADYHRFQSLVARAAARDALDFDEPSERAYLAAGRRVVDLCDELVAVWDEKPARGLGGTADAVAYARAQGRPVTIVWEAGVDR